MTKPPAFEVYDPRAMDSRCGRCVVCRIPGAREWIAGSILETRKAGRRWPIQTLRNRVVKHFGVHFSTASMYRHLEHTPEWSDGEDPS